MGGAVPQAAPEIVEELAVDYCQLLIGPKEQMSPIQSVWDENKLQGSAATSMRHYLVALPNFHPPGNVPDHIGVQLAFIAELFLRASAADDPDAFEQLASRFFVDHITWTDRLFDLIESRSQTEFYMGLAKISRQFLAFEPDENLT